MNIEFAKGTKLLLRDVWRFLDGELWPWLQALSTIVFVFTIFVFEKEIISNTLLMFILLILWLAFNLFAMWRNYELEKR